MKTHLFTLALASLPLLLSAAEPVAAQQNLLGAWLTSGNPDRPAYIANSGPKWFAIDEHFVAWELFSGENGSLVAKSRNEEITGQAKGDTILWNNSIWWSREPLPPPPDDAVIWGDPGSGWIPLRTIGIPAMDDSKEPRWEWGGPEAPRMGGKLYRRDQFLFAHAPKNLKFTFEKPITEFRAVIGLIEGGRLGSVTFKVRTDSGIVFTSKPISHAWNNTEKVELKFAPSKTLELITEAAENNYEDWSNWLVPEVR